MSRPSSTKHHKPKTLRCAVYTRKSTDHNLDMAFNSLDAQREACEAYIKSQQHEGWTLIPDHYDDGAFSGASLDRPALQELLQSVRDGRIDVIVVYKVDRLTRSLADFAKLVELFDEKSVSFVSVTQSFNTTSSMGRLTLNVLLSFAQFEREVIGERVRDKIAASKKKGIWVGGTIPLGYRSVNKKLEIIPEEAKLVRKIYKDYLELGSIADLAKRLNDEGLKPKPRQLSNGRRIEPERYRVGPLAHMLKNRFYIGEVVYRGETNPGEHPAILDRDLFEAVQQKLAAARVNRNHNLAKSKHILRGLIFDDRGNRMTPSHSNKKGVRYRYYVSNPTLHKQNHLAGTVSRIPAPDVEQMAMDAVANKFGIADNGSTDYRQHVLLCIRRIVVHKDKLVITCLAPGGVGIVDGIPDQHSRREDVDGFDERNEQHEIDADPASEEITLTIPCSFPAQTKRKGLASTPDQQATLDPRSRDAILKTIASAQNWIDDLASGKIASFDDIAAREGKVVRHIRFLAPLAFVSPKIVKAIIHGNVPADLTVSSLARNLPHDWSEQERRLGLN